MERTPIQETFLPSSSDYHCSTSAPSVSTMALQEEDHYPSRPRQWVGKARDYVQRSQTSRFILFLVSFFLLYLLFAFLVQICYNHSVVSMFPCHAKPMSYFVSLVFIVLVDLFVGFFGSYRTKCMNTFR